MRSWTRDSPQASPPPGGQGHDDIRPVLIGPDEVHVWVSSLTGADSRTLSLDELARADRIRPPAARRRFIAARAITRAVLGSYVGASAETLCFDSERLGKPGLRDHALRFNVSHAGDVLVCAIAASMEVGIDVEGPEFVTSPSPTLIERILSRRERRWIDALDRDLAPGAVLRAWVRKEAVSKGLGEGLGLSFPLIETPRSLEASGSRVRVRGRHRERWFVWDIPVAPGWAAAVAAPVKRIRLRALSWDGEAAEPGSGAA